MTTSNPPVLLPEEVVGEPVYDGSTPLRVARREHFAQFYVHKTRGCAAQAARLAGYSQDLDASKTEGSRLLAVADVRKRVNYLTKKLWEPIHMSEEELLGRAAALARTDIARLQDAHGHWLPLHEMPPDATAVIAGIEVDEIQVGENVIGVTKKIKLRDSHAAMRTLMQVRKMLGPDTKTNVNINLADRMARARKRARAKE